MKKPILKPNLKKTLLPVLIFNLCILLGGCRNEQRQEGEGIHQTTVEDTIANTPVEVRIFTGEISAINPEQNNNREVNGTVSLRVEGRLMRFHISAEGLAPNVMHMQYLQTSERGEPVPCPGMDADANKDGIVDVSETSPVARGIRMIPLHMGPSTLEVNVDTYPSTNANGELEFARTVSLDSLSDAVRTAYGIQELDFANFTYIIQGVEENASIPQTAQSVSRVPVNQSIPVGCAQLEEESSTTTY